MIRDKWDCVKAYIRRKYIDYNYTGQKIGLNLIEIFISRNIVSRLLYNLSLLLQWGMVYLISASRNNVIFCRGILYNATVHCVHISTTAVAFAKCVLSVIIFVALAQRTCFQNIRKLVCVRVVMRMRVCVYVIFRRWLTLHFVERT